MKSYALGLIRHIMDDENTPPKRMLEQIKLALRSEEIISGWIDENEYFVSWNKENKNEKTHSFDGTPF